MIFSGYVKNNASMVPVIDRFNADLINGNWDGRTGGLISYDHLQYLAIVEDETSKIVSFLIYELRYQKFISVSAGWTDPDHRRQGHYNTLFKHLVKLATAADCITINGSTHKTNEIMLKIMKSQNRIVDGTSLCMGSDFFATKLTLKEPTA